MSPSSSLRAGPSTSWLSPTPPLVAIEIATRRITVVEITRGAAGTQVSAYASEPIGLDAVTPALTGVNIANPTVVTDAVKRAFDKAGIPPARRAALIVPDAIARVSLVHFDQVPAKATDLDQLVKWQIRKSTPFPLEEARVDHMPANTQDGGATFAAVMARRDVILQYEAAVEAAGVHAGIVDLASLNVMNAVMGAGAAPATDWLLICMAHDATTIAILRGTQLLFYRQRAAIDNEPLSALVHQTAMYHEDRLGGSAFSKVWLAGAALADTGADRARREISARLGVTAEAVDIRPAAALGDRIQASPDVLDALAAPVGVLIRERAA